MDDMHEVDIYGVVGQPPHDPLAAGRCAAVPEDLPARASAPRRRPSAAEAAVPSGAIAPDLVLTAQELERQRIAVDLHDGLGPLLTLIQLELTHAAGLLGADSRVGHELGPVIGRASGHVSRAFDELRRTVINLRPAMLDDLGIIPTLGWLIREFQLSGPALQMQVDLALDEEDVPAELKIVIFRICQEGLNNIVKHAGARRAMVSLACAGELLQLQVEDDGCGLSPEAADWSNRVGGGLAGMHRRATSSGGQCQVASEPGAGTCIRVAWPLGQRHAIHAR
jgi:signal transduction histidine kinase